MNQHQFIEIICAELKLKMSVMAGDPAYLTGGIGGWKQVEVADSVALTEWSGNSPVTQDVPIFLNGLQEGNSIQPQVNKIIQLGRKTTGDQVPPLFRLAGPIHFPQLTWCLENAEFGQEEIVRDKNQNLVRQEVTLSVLEYINPDQIRRPKKRQAYGPGHGGTTAPGSSYTTKKGDTLGSIAASIYGDRSRWKILSEKNPPLRDPNKAIKKGTKLKLPVNPWP